MITEMVVAGDGPETQLGCRVHITVKYHIEVDEGEQVEKDLEAQLSHGHLIKGLVEALLKMREGGTERLVLTPEMAFRNLKVPGLGKIAKHNLILWVTLNRVGPH
jgi:FKBP-type peptidyl-prolyl cis-trans isomerase